MTCGSSLAASDQLGLRFVTVAFCDIAGSTQLALSFDPEVWHAILGEYFGAVSRALVDAGGRLEKFIGDAVVGVFGADVPSENDAVRAVSGSLAALKNLAESNAARLTRYGIRLSIRFGVASGRVVLADRDSSFAIGTVMNRAARLQAAAPNEGVVVDVRTWLLVRDSFVCAPVAPVAAKGFDKPLQAWSVVTTRGTRSAAPVFVNQDALQERILDGVRRGIRTPGMTTIAVTGELGSGKSRVLERVAEHVRQERAFALHIAGEKSDADRVVWRLAQIMRDIGVPLNGGRAKPSRSEMQWIIRRQLARLSQQQPVIITVDDYQRLPTEARDALTNGLQADCGPMVVVATGREQPIAADLRLHVPALTETDALRLLGTIREDIELHGTAVDDSRLIERSRGNPLFLEQLMALAAAGIDDEVAPSAEAALGARIERLGRPARHLLGCAGAWGRPANQDELEAVCDLGEGELAGAITELETTGLLESEIAADVAYAHMPIAERARVHTAIAHKLQTLAEREPALVETSAVHGLRGRRFWHEYDPGSDGELAARHLAATCMIAAARHAIARSEIRQAAQYCADARNLGLTDGALLLEVAALESYALGAAGRAAEAREQIDSVVSLTGNPSARIHLSINQAVLTGQNADGLRALARETDDEAAVARVDAWEGLLAAREGDYGRAEALLRSARAAVRRSVAGLGVAEIYGNLSLFLLYGDSPLSQAIRDCEELRHEVEDAPLLHAAVTCPTAVLLALQGHTEVARRMLDDARERFAGMGHAWGLAGACEFSSVASELDGDLTRAAHHARAARDVYSEAGASAAAARAMARAYLLEPVGPAPRPQDDWTQSWETRLLRSQFLAVQAMSAGSAASAIEHLDAALAEVSTIKGMGARVIPLNGCLRIAEGISVLSGDAGVAQRVRAEWHACWNARR